MNGLGRFEVRLAAAAIIGITAPFVPANGQPAPAAPRLEFAFEELVTLGPAIAPGKTPYGARNMVPITGGTFAGPGIRGTILPGGWDWQLVRADGCLDVHADYMLKTDDGVVINVVNNGALCRAGSAGPSQPVRTSPRFEAPLGRYDWLNRTAFIGTLDAANGPKEERAVRIRFYKAM